jgi:hypothetical protein
MKLKWDKKLEGKHKEKTMLDLVALKPEKNMIM